MNEINHYIASKLKSLRKKKGWSLDKTSSATGISKAMLGQIERGESNPTVATMWKIATGFQQSLSSLIEPTNAYNDETQIRRNVEQTILTDEGTAIPPIIGYDDRFGFELFELTLMPNYERLSAPHESGVTEHVIVICGEMEVLVNGKWEFLSKRDSVRFSADQPHGYRNPGNEPVTFHNLIHYQSRPQS